MNTITEPNPNELHATIKLGIDAHAKCFYVAHKLARILWAMVKHRRPYDPDRLGNPELVRVVHGELS